MEAGEGEACRSARSDVWRFVEASGVVKRERLACEVVHDRGVVSAVAVRFAQQAPGAILRNTDARIGHSPESALAAATERHARTLPAWEGSFSAHRQRRTPLPTLNHPLAGPNLRPALRCATPGETTIPAIRKKLPLPRLREGTPLYLPTAFRTQRTAVLHLWAHRFAVQVTILMAGSRWNETGRWRR